MSTSADTRPVAPHGIEEHPRHPVVIGCLRPSKKDPEGKPEPSFVIVLLFAPEVAVEEITKGGYRKELHHQEHPQLVFPSDTPGQMQACYNKRCSRANLQVCAGGILLPGAPPPILHSEPVAASAYPFAFLAGVHRAIHLFPAWTEWALAEGIDVGALHQHIKGGTPAKEYRLPDWLRNLLR